MGQSAPSEKPLPEWQGQLSIEPLTGGVSNVSYKVTDDTGTYVMRLGKDYPFHQVSREREAIASQAAYDAGLAPELVYAKEGMMVLRYLKAKACSERDVRRSWRTCIDLVKRCHSDMPKRISGQGAIFWAFQIIRDYCKTLTENNHARTQQVPRWLEITDRMEAQQIPMPVIFGHHDLLPNNFLDDGKRLWLIDWEYSAFGTPLFDLANLAANNSFDSATEAEMLEYYFERKPDEALLRAFSAMKVAAGLREATWGMVSELFLEAPGADYVAYASEYLSRFEAILTTHEKSFGK